MAPDYWLVQFPLVKYWAMSKPEVVLFISSNQIAVFSTIMPKALVYGCSWKENKIGTDYTIDLGHPRANQMNEQHFENTFVPQDLDLGDWSSYLKTKRLL